MAKLNLDEVSQLAEPIEVTIDGKTYVATKITTEKMNDAAELADGKDTNALAKQLGILLGVDPSEFMETDVRKLGKALDFITKELTKGLTEKNG